MTELYPLELTTLTTAEQAQELGVTSASEIAVMVEAKDQGNGSRTTLFTLEMFQEMIELEDFILNLTA